MMKFEGKGLTVLAVQFPGGFRVEIFDRTNVVNWEIQTIDTKVSVRICRKDLVDLILNEGDWLIKLMDGNLFVIPDLVMYQLFQEVKGG